MAIINRIRSTMALFPLLLCCAGVARADPVAAPTDEPPPAVTTDATDQQAPPSKKKWEFATIGYVWFASAKGETDVIGPLDAVGVDLPFSKVLKAFKFAFMGAAEARRDRLVILGDLTYVHLDAKKGIDIRNQDFLDAELDTKTAEITLVGGYRVVNKGPVFVDLLAGTRLNFLKTSLQLEGPNRSAEGTVKQTWLDPLIATRIQAPLGGKWNLALYGDLGGIIFGSDVTWQGIASVNYQISRKMSLGAGYRYYKVKYTHGDFLYDIHQYGPMIVFRTVL